MPCKIESRTSHFKWNKGVILRILLVTVIWITLYSKRDVNTIPKSEILADSTHSLRRAQMSNSQVLLTIMLMWMMITTWTMKTRRSAPTWSWWSGRSGWQHWRVGMPWWAATVALSGLHRHSGHHSLQHCPHPNYYSRQHFPHLD